LQLTAHRHGRPPNSEPARVKRLVLVRQRLMTNWIVELDNGILGRDRVRNVDIGPERARDTRGECGLAVAGGSVEEERLPGVDGRSDLVDHFGMEHEILERLLYRPLGDGDISNAL